MKEKYRKIVYAGIVVFYIFGIVMGFVAGKTGYAFLINHKRMAIPDKDGMGELA